MIEDTEEIKNKKEEERMQQPAEVAEPNPTQVAPVTPVLRYVLKHRDGSNLGALFHLDSDESPSPLFIITATSIKLPSLLRRLTVPGEREGMRTTARSPAIALPPTTEVPSLASSMWIRRQEKSGMRGSSKR